MTGQVTDALDQFHFADAARQLYDFAWDEFCSFYVEMVKTRLSEPASRATAQRVLAHTLDSLVRLLHPMIPFITEEIWQRLAEAAPQRGLTNPTRATESVMIAPWPEADRRLQDSEIEAQFAQFQEVLAGLARSSQPAEHSAQDADPLRRQNRSDDAEASRADGPLFRRDGRRDRDRLGTDRSAAGPIGEFHRGGLRGVCRSGRPHRPRRRTSAKEKESEQLRQQIEAKEKKLANENFVSRAPADVVQKERESLTALRDRLASTSAALAELNRP